MAEYIEREALLKEAESRIMWGASAAAVYELIRDVPAADVALVVHGRWEVVVGSDGKEHMVCTVCRKQQDLTGVFSYCPNCGAKMDL